MRALEELKDRGMADCLHLLHFHLGSQITNIRQVKGAVNEAARMYAELARAGAGLKYLDVGGGLGIDYDGSQTDFESSVNYTLQEYANDVVYHIQNVCDESGVPHPTIVTESGRAIVGLSQRAGVQRTGRVRLWRRRRSGELPAEPEQPLIDLQETYRSLSAKNLLESYHDAQQALDQALNLFSLGYLPLEQRCLAENLYWSICRRIQKLARELDYFPEEFEGLDALLSDTYFCNFSLFQSMPDSWAIKQLFPIMPIHRLDEQPTQYAVLGDITCDSDGKVDQFIDRRDVKRTLPLHPYNGRGLLSRRVPAGRLPGDPGRPAQPVRRYQRGPRAAQRSGRSHPRCGDQRRHRARGARLRAVQRRRAGHGSCAETSRPPCAKAA